MKSFIVGVCVLFAFAAVTARGGNPPAYPPFGIDPSLSKIEQLRQLSYILDGPPITASKIDQLRRQSYRLDGPPSASSGAPSKIEQLRKMSSIWDAPPTETPPAKTPPPKTPATPGFAI